MTVKAQGCMHWAACPTPQECKPIMNGPCGLSKEAPTSKTVTEHELKVASEFFDAVESGQKPFEIRKGDRPFKVGDTLWLREVDIVLAHTGREARKRITFVLRGWGMESGYVALGLESLRVETSPRRMHVRRNGEKDTGHTVDFSFVGDVDAGSHIQMTLNGVEVCMTMREWHSLALNAVEPEPSRAFTMREAFGLPEKPSEKPLQAETRAATSRDARSTEDAGRPGPLPEKASTELPPAFKSLLDLEPNWDSYGAKRIQLACVQKAYEIWKQLAGTWLPVPHSDGTVGLEQHTGGFDIEIDVDLALPPLNGE